MVLLENGIISTAMNSKIIGFGSEVIVLAHGYGGDQSVWDKILPSLAQHCRVLVFDWTFSGAVEDPNLYDPLKYSSYDAFADDLISLLDEMNLQSSVFIGHSMSGMIGCIASIKRPELFKRLVLIVSSPRNSPLPDLSPIPKPNPNAAVRRRGRFALQLSTKRRHPRFRMSSSVSSSSLLNHTSSKVPMCNCGKQAILRISNTRRNPGRAFFGCPLYNKEGLPYCKFFKWSDSSEYKEQDEELKKREADLLRKDEELKKREADLLRKDEELKKRYAKFLKEEELKKREVEVLKKDEETKKIEEKIGKRELAVHNDETQFRSQEADMRHARILFCVLWLIAIVIYLYLILLLR